MPKRLIRGVSLLLVLALVMDPTLVRAAGHPVDRPRRTVEVECFSVQAFAPRDPWMREFVGPFVKVLVIQLTFNLLNHLWAIHTGHAPWLGGGFVGLAALPFNKKMPQTDGLQMNRRRLFQTGIATVLSGFQSNQAQSQENVEANENMALFQELLRTTVVYKKTRYQADYHGGEPEKILRALVDYRTRYVQWTNEEYQKPQLSKAAAPFDPAAIREMYNAAWMAMRKAAVSETLSEALSQDYSPKRFYEFLFGTLPVYTASYGLMTTIIGYPHIDPNEIVRDITFVPLFYEIESIEQAPIDEDLRAELLRRGVSAPQLIFFEAYLGPNLERQLNRERPLFNQNNSVFWLKSHFEDTLQRGTEIRASRLQIIYGTTTPANPLQALTFDWKKLVAGARDSASAFRQGVDVLTYWWAYVFRTVDLGVILKKAMSSHELGHVLKAHDSDRSFEQAINIQLPMPIRDYQAKTFSREVHEEIEAQIYQIMYGETVNEWRDVMKFTGGNNPDDVNGAHNMAFQWIFYRAFDLVMDADLGGPARFGIRIFPDSPLSARDQAIVQMTVLAQSQNHEAFQKLMRELLKQHEREYSFQFLPEMRNMADPPFRTRPVRASSHSMWEWLGPVGVWIAGGAVLGVVAVLAVVLWRHYRSGHQGPPSDSNGPPKPGSPPASGSAGAKPSGNPPSKTHRNIRHVRRSA